MQACSSIEQSQRFNHGKKKISRPQAGGMFVSSVPIGAPFKLTFLQKFRASWNKYNLYNLSRLKPINTAFYTFYQQKWAAKSMTRAYHGEQIREKQWQRMFTPHLNSVVPMDHRYLAEHDGSELAAGRGSGKEQPTKGKMNRGKMLIPYMHMTYAPIERRLDMAIFRALFASSARQARQFVTHGKVRVNGKKVNSVYGFLPTRCSLFLDAISRISVKPRRFVSGRTRLCPVCHRSSKGYGPEKERKTSSKILNKGQHHNGEVQSPTKGKKGGAACF